MGHEPEHINDLPIVMERSHQAVSVTADIKNDYGPATSHWNRIGMRIYPTNFRQAPPRGLSRYFEPGRQRLRGIRKLRCPSFHRTTVDDSHILHFAMHITECQVSMTNVSGCRVALLVSPSSARRISTSHWWMSRGSAVVDPTVLTYN